MQFQLLLAGMATLMSVSGVLAECGCYKTLRDTWPAVPTSEIKKCGITEAAELPEPWLDMGLHITGYFETSVAGAAAMKDVTNDFDCAGISVGVLQWNFSNGQSLHDLMRRVGTTRLLPLLSEKMRTRGCEMACALVGDYQSAQKIVRKWQRLKGTSQPLGDTYQCVQEQKKEFIDPFITAELASLLDTPEVRQAQRSKASDVGCIAYSRASEWSRVARASASPRFYEFMFFFDYVTQISGSYTKQILELVSEIKRVNASNDNYPKFLRDRLSMLTAWLGGNWSFVAEPHRRDGVVNGKTWIELYDCREGNANCGKLDESQVRLLYFAFTRSLLVSPPYTVDSLNRKGAMAAGEGNVHGSALRFWQCPFMKSAASDTNGGIGDLKAAQQCVEFDGRRPTRPPTIAAIESPRFSKPRITQGVPLGRDWIFELQ